MKKKALNMVALFAFLHIYGCSGIPITPWGKNASLLHSHSAKALDYEKNGDLQMALFSWKIAHSLNPSEKKLSSHIARLESKIENDSEKHFNKGVIYLKDQSLKAARKEFLSALRIKPGHQKALSYLKDTEINKTYTVKKGDTLKIIAQKIYKDPEKYFLISYFNDLDATKELVPETMLKLPILETIDIVPFMDVENELMIARNYLESKNYEKALSIISNILEFDASNKEANDLANSSNYQLAMKLNDEKKYLDSLRIFNKVDREYQGVKKAIFKIKETIKKEVELHYKLGVKFFLKEELRKAIAEWEKTLALEPNHPQAKEDIKKTKHLLEKLNEMK